MTTSSKSACSPFRMRVRKSAMGSFSDMRLSCLPARLRQAGDLALVGDLAHADAAEAELAQVRARPTAPFAAVVLAGLYFAPARLAHLLGRLCHYWSPPSWGSGSSIGAPRGANGMPSSRSRMYASASVLADVVIVTSSPRTSSIAS